MRIRWGKYIFFVFMFNIVQIIGKEQTKSPKPQAIIFDLHGVLFQEDSIAFAKKVGLGAISSYTVSHWKNPVNTCLDTLQHMSNDANHYTNIKMSFNNRQMPHCIVEWQCGRKSYREVHSELSAYWDNLHKNNYFKSAKEKKITESILRVALDPDEFSTIAKPIQATLKLVRKLKDQGYKLYLTGNIPQEPYDIMLKKHSEINELFDGIYVSSQVGFIKPNAQMFTHILKKHNIDPYNCLVIDDEKEDIAVAQNIGMQAILFINAQRTEKLLKKQGIL